MKFGETMISFPPENSKKVKYKLKNKEIKEGYLLNDHSGIWEILQWFSTTGYMQFRSTNDVCIDSEIIGV